MNNSFQIALDQLEDNIINADGVRAINVCNAADDLLAVLQTTAGNLRSLIAASNCTTYDIWLEVVDAAIAKATPGIAA